MKYIVAAALAASTLAAGTAALADNHDHDRDHGRGRSPQSYSRYHEGQVYRGHRLHQVHGRWGYYRPHNGVNLFISI